MPNVSPRTDLSHTVEPAPLRAKRRRLIAATTGVAVLTGAVVLSGSFMSGVEETEAQRIASQYVAAQVMASVPAGRAAPQLLAAGEEAGSDADQAALDEGNPTPISDALDPETTLSPTSQSSPDGTLDDVSGPRTSPVSTTTRTRTSSRTTTKSTPRTTTTTSVRTSSSLRPVPVTSVPTTVPATSSAMPSTQPSLSATSSAPSTRPTVIVTSTFTSTSTATPTTVPEPSTEDVDIPDEPETLPPKAETDEVGTAEVQGEEFDVVVVSSEDLPRDAKRGVDALEAWLNGDDPGDDWSMFVSAEPGDDGWRWAAISQKTGTVLFIR